MILCKHFLYFLDAIKFELQPGDTRIHLHWILRTLETTSLSNYFLSKPCARLCKLHHSSKCFSYNSFLHKTLLMYLSCAAAFYHCCMNNNDNCPCCNTTRHWTLLKSIKDSTWSNTTYRAIISYLKCHHHQSLQIKHKTLILFFYCGFELFWLYYNSYCLNKYWIVKKTYHFMLIIQDNA